MAGKQSLAIGRMAVEKSANRPVSRLQDHVPRLKDVSWSRFGYTPIYLSGTRIFLPEFASIIASITNCIIVRD